MMTSLKVLVFITCALLVFGGPIEDDSKVEDKVSATKATLKGMTSTEEDVELRAPACAVPCPGTRYCCNWSAPICAGRGMCCPRDRPNLWGNYCVW